MTSLAMFSDDAGPLLGAVCAAITRAQIPIAAQTRARKVGFIGFSSTGALGAGKTVDRAAAVMAPADAVFKAV
jgi:hypothetical protein